MRRVTGLLAAVCLLVMTAGFAYGYTATKEFRETYPLPADRELEVKNVNGDISVTTWDRDEVEIYAEIEVRASSKRDAEEFLDEVRIDVRKTRRRIRVEADYPRRGGGGLFDWLFGRRPPDVRVQFWIKVPKQARIDLNTVNGSVEVEEVEGVISLSTTNGRIEATDVGGEIEANTVNGGIRVEVAELDPESRLRFETVNGSIRLYLPEDVRADVDASTVNGSIHTDFPIEVTGKYVGKHARGAIQGGGALIRLRTVNGSIDILER